MDSTSAATPASFSAKYAFTEALISAGPSAKMLNPPSGNCLARIDRTALSIDGRVGGSHLPATGGYSHNWNRM